MSGTDGSIEYVADTLLLQKIEAMDWALANGKGIEKAAFAGGDALNLSREKNVIESAVSSVIDTSSTGSIIKSVLKILETGVLFKISPLLGIASVIGQAFGYSLTDWVSSALPPIKKKIKEEGTISPQEVNEAVANAAPGGGIEAAAMLKPLHDIEKNGELVKMLSYELPLHKEAQSWWQSGGPFMGGGKGTPWYYRAFGFLSGANRKKLLGGIIAWVLKTVLLGAAVLGIGGAAMGMIGGPSPLPGKQQQQKEQQTLTPDRDAELEREMTGQAPAAGRGDPRLRGTMPPVHVPMVGTYISPQRLRQVSRMTPEEMLAHHRATTPGRHRTQRPSGVMFQMAPNGTPGDVVMQYAIQKSPHLSEYHDIISRMPSFNAAVAALSRGHKPGDRVLVAPPDAVTKMNLFVLKANRRARQEQQKAQTPA